MKSLSPYLFFDGNCRKAMEFYKECLGGKLEIMTYADGPPDACPQNVKDKTQVMHSCLVAGPVNIMASDSTEDATTPGTNIQLCLECESAEEIEMLFSKLAKNGNVLMPLADQFWGSRFGVLTDQFGIRWMLNSPTK